MSRPETLGALRDSGWVSTPLRDEIRRTVADEEQVDDEIRYLLGLLRDH